MVHLKTLQSLHIWDRHSHLIGFHGSTPTERMAEMIRFADRMGVERMRVFLGVLQPILNAKGVKA